MNYNAAYCESSLAPATARLLPSPSNSVVLERNEGNPVIAVGLCTASLAGVM
jgi:hypothetical protein